MTTTTDMLTQWLPLWEQDEELRPEGLAIDKAQQFWFESGTGKCAMRCRLSVAAALIRDSAVRWLAKKMRACDIFYNGDEGWAVGAGNVVGHLFNEADTLDDALYAACKAVLGEDKT